MTEDEMTTIVKRFTNESWNQENLDLLPEFFAEEYVGHDVPNPQPVLGPEGMRAFLHTFHLGLKNAHIELDDVIVTDDKVVTRWTGTGTHAGEVLGVPATGKAVTFTGIRIFRFADGKIVEGWVNWDVFGLMKQLGAI
jgi:steroid delta-isomerase-like uncharacterized protein